MRRALLLALLLPAVVIGTTWWALEADGVARVETRRAGGELRVTHVWFVEQDGDLWVEAGSERNGWYRDIQQEPRLQFDRGAGAETRVARPVLEIPRRDALRAALREKYGFRDWWLGWLVNRSEAIAVRLDPAVPGAGPSEGADP